MRNLIDLLHPFRSSSPTPSFRLSYVDSPDSEDPRTPNTNTDVSNSNKRLANKGCMMISFAMNCIVFVVLIYFLFPYQQCHNVIEYISFPPLVSNSTVTMPLVPPPKTAVLETSSNSSAVAINTATENPEVDISAEKQCKGRCCWQWISTHYRQYSESFEPKQEDYLRVCSARWLADIGLVFGSASRPEDQSNLPLWHDEFIDCLQPGTVIYSESISVKDWFDKQALHVKASYVFVSGDYDFDSTHHSYEHIINSAVGKYILHWFSHNSDVNQNQIDPNRFFTPLPIGTSQWTSGWQVIHKAWQTHPMSPSKRFIYADQRLDFNLLGPMKTAKKLLFASFHKETHPSREIILNEYVLNKWKDFVHFELFNFNESFTGVDFYHLQQTYKFGLSPRGNGQDCYRTWEYLYLGIIPIVLSSDMDPVYATLPVLILKSWDELNIELLEKTWSTYQKLQWSAEKLYLPYWKDQIFKYRNTTSPFLKLEYTLNQQTIS